MNAQLEALLTQEAERQAAREADKAIAKQNATGQVRAAMREAIGTDLYAQFKEQGMVEEVKASPNRYGTEEIRWSVEIVWQVNGSDDARLCPITLRACCNSYDGKVSVFGSRWHNQQRREEVSLPERLAEFLLEARVHWMTWRKDRAEAELEKIKSWGWAIDEATPPKLEALKSDYPEFVERFNQVAVECQAAMAEQQTKERERLERERKEEEERAAWRQVFADETERYVEFLGEYNAVMERNIARRRAIQAKLDQPTQVFKMTYGVCALDEEGEHYADTDTEIAYMLEGQPDEGYWLRTDGQRVKVYHPVLLEPLTIKASDEVWPLYRSRHIGEQFNVYPLHYFHWLHTTEEVDRMIADASFESVPEFEWSKDIRGHGRDDVVQKANERVEALCDSD